MKHTTLNRSPGRRDEAPDDPSKSIASDSHSAEFPAGSATEQLGRELAREFRRRWRHGERPAAEELLNQNAELWQRPDAAIELVYEEFCLRQAGGDLEVDQDLMRRFPQWAGPLGVMLDCHRMLQSDRELPQLPAVGETVGEFRLLAELGRGARGRVFLATQTALADRPVVLKITPLDGGEHLSLARLQHTNIVPLYSVLDETTRGIRILCMPYFGRATLASLLQSLAEGQKGVGSLLPERPGGCSSQKTPDPFLPSGVPLAARTGQHVVDAIDRMQQPSPTPAAPAAAARQMLAHVSYGQAMCWITACLADALQFAHERGLVHLDLKPSNVLLATDGQPMLLDFHLARELPLSLPSPPAAVGDGRVKGLSGSPVPEIFGGTPGYMPPEQQAAMRSLQNGRPVEMTVDGRADIYSLGAMLYESLGGQLPIGTASPALAELNSQVSVGLSDIVAKCVAHRPADRYADAASLADDLRRHLTDQPLAGVPNRGIAECWHKWRRRRPNTLRAAGMLAVVAGAASVLLAGTWSQSRDRRDQAERALSDGRTQLQRGQLAEATETFERGLALAESLSFQRDLQSQLREQLTTAKRLQVGQQLHDLADEIRVLYGADSIPPDRLRSIASHCRALWEKRHAIADRSLGLQTRSLGSDEPSHDDVATDLKDIAIFAAGLEVKLSTDAETGTGRRSALRMLDEAEAMFGPSAVLENERRIQRQALGFAESAGPSSPRPAPPAPRTAWEHYALGRSYLASGDLARAGEELAQARELDPAGLWPNFYYGLSAYRARRYEDAVAALSVCIGAAPHVAGCYYNRALAYAALGRSDQSMHDYDRALELDPTQAAAALNRGMLHYEKKNLNAALADLRLALELGSDAATVHYDLALVHVAANDDIAALEEAQRAMDQNPAHEQAQKLREMLQRKSRRDHISR